MRFSLHIDFGLSTCRRRGASAAICAAAILCTDRSRAQSQPDTPPVEVVPPPAEPPGPGPIAAPSESVPPPDPYPTAKIEASTPMGGVRRGAALEDPGDPLDWFEIQTPDASETQIDDIFADHTATLSLPTLEQPISWLLGKSRELERATGLRVAGAYTVLFQQATGGAGDRTAAAGDLDIMTDWTLIGRGTKDTGRFVFTGEYRHNFGGTVPGGLGASSLGTQIGSIVGTSGGFNDRGWVVRDAFWDQRLLDGKIRILAGRADPSDFVGAYRMQSINNSFSNRAFSANQTTAFPAGHGPTALVTVRPTNQFYVTAGAANAYSRSTTFNVQSLVDNWDLFSFGEAGFTPTIDNLGWGRYAIFLWNVASRPETNQGSDWGFSLIGEQNFSDRLYGFARYSYADPATANIENAAQIGVGYSGLFGSVDNQAGLAFGWLQPRNGDLRDEKVVELFQRWQLTTHSQFTIDLQCILDPSNDPDSDVVGVFGGRFRLDF